MLCKHLLAANYLVNQEQLLGKSAALVQLRTFPLSRSEAALLTIGKGISLRREMAVSQTRTPTVHSDTPAEDSSIYSDEDSSAPDSSTSESEEEGKGTAGIREKRPAGQKDGRSGGISNRSGLVMDDEDDSSTSDCEEEGEKTAASSEKRPAEQKNGQCTSIHTCQGTSNRPLVKVDYYISSFIGRIDDDDEDSTSDSEEKKANAQNLQQMREKKSRKQKTLRIVVKIAGLVSPLKGSAQAMLLYQHAILKQLLHEMALLESVPVRIECPPANFRNGTIAEVRRIVDSKNEIETLPKGGLYGTCSH